MKRMKKSINLILLALIIGVGSVFAQTKTEKIKVEGKCGMCKMRIEKAAKGVEGVSAASWDKKTHVLELTFDAAKVKTLDVQKVIAKAGHDTELVKADDNTFNALPQCCHYERMKYKK